MKAAAQRYARALADVAMEHKSGGALARELAGFAGLLEESTDLRNFLNSPAVAREHKHAVIGKLCARTGTGTAMRNFLFVVVDGRRMAMLAEIQSEFEAELLDRQHMAEAYVTSARELTAAEQAALTRGLEQQTGKRIQATAWRPLRGPSSSAGCGSLRRLHGSGTSAVQPKNWRNGADGRP